MKKRFLGQDIMKGEWKPGGGGQMSNSIASGSARPSLKLGDDGTSERGIDTEAGISIFDPVLCELMYSWFSPPEGAVLDPFAGGSVRGVVASKLKRNYIGIELRKEQVEANKEQGNLLCPDRQPVWHCADSRTVDDIVQPATCDFIFSCPPYADLEVYSDDPRDLSTMEYPMFMDAYREIILKSCECLKENRFACFVVGEVRGANGNYLGFVPDTIKAFKDAGLELYNEAILITAIGSLPIRAGRAFKAGRKLGKTHQNVLVFIKGDGKKATIACGDVYLPDISVGEQV